VEDSDEEEELHPNCFIDPSPTSPIVSNVEDSDNSDDPDPDPDPTLKAIADRIKALEQRSSRSRITVSTIAAAAIHGDLYQPLIGQQLVFKEIISSSNHASAPQHAELMGDTGCASLFIDSSCQIVGLDQFV
jgi:hypothetical protein